MQTFLVISPMYEAVIAFYLYKKTKETQDLYLTTKPIAEATHSSKHHSFQ